MKLLVMTLSLVFAVTACNKTPQEKYEKQKMEANKDYRDEVKDARQDMQEAKGDYQVERDKVRQDMEDADHERNKDLLDAKKDYDEDMNDEVDD